MNKQLKELVEKKIEKMLEISTYPLPSQEEKRDNLNKTMYAKQTLKDEAKKIMAQYFLLYEDRDFTSQANQIDIAIDQIITRTTQHTLEQVNEVLEKLNKDSEKFVPFQKIHYQSAITDAQSAVNKLNI